MKLYVHYEHTTHSNPALSEFTKVLRLNDDDAWTVSDLLAWFSEEYNGKHGPGLLHPHALCALDENQKQLQPKLKLRKLADHADVFVHQEQKQVADMQHAVCRHTANGSSTTPATTAATSQQPEAAAVVATVKPCAQPIGTAGTTAAATTSNDGSRAAKAPPSTQGTATDTQLADDPALQSQVNSLLKVCMDKADAAVKADNYRVAGVIYDQMCEAAPGQPPLLERAARMWLHSAKLPTRALPYARKLAATCPESHTALQLLGEALLGAGKPSEALKAFDSALVCAKASGETATVCTSLQIDMARAMFAHKDNEGIRDLAAKLVMDVLEGDEGHWEGLWLYATIAEERGMRDDALAVALRLLVARSGHAGVRALLARCLLAPGGMGVLYDQLAGSSEGGGASNAAAYAFLATAVKDHGAVRPAIKLLEKAVAQEPLHITYALNLAHAHELEQDMGAAVRVARETCQAIAKAGSAGAGLQLGGGCSLTEVAGLLQGLPDLDPPVTSLAWRHMEGWTPPHTNGPAPNQATGGASASSAAVSSSGSSGDGSSGSSSIEYSSSQLDMLALCFTAAKVLYVGGAVSRAAALARVLNRARAASKVELHTTLIRNEAAYFGCVYQLVTDHPPPAFGPQLTSSSSSMAGSSQAGADAQSDGTTQAVAGSGVPPLYLCGDSHCLSAAWHYVSLRGERRLLQPLLVTGCKIWHLRPSSNFYPKHQFLASMAGLPDKAQVVMLLGEIDCREGLLLAVQKCKYESIEEGMAATIDIYIKVLLHLITTRGFEVFVHPVPPVLNETRTVVTAFVKMLKTKVEAAAASPAARGRLHFLDFFSQLLTPDGASLSPELSFDGTHMAPTYVKYLDAALP